MLKLKRMKMFKIKGTRKLESFIIESTVILLILFSLIIEAIGYNRFTTAYTKEYNDTAFKTAITASTMFDVDKIDDYLKKNGESEEYQMAQAKLNTLCETQDVATIVIMVPDKDYKHYTIVFDSVNSYTGYTPWEIGYRKETQITKKHNYQKIYRDIFEGKKERVVVVRHHDKETKSHINFYMPLKNMDDDIVAIIQIQKFTNNLSKTRRNYIISVSILTILSIILTFIATLIFIRKQIVKPVIKINNEAERFANEEPKKRKDIRKISKISEIESLAIAIDKMESDTIKYINHLTNVTKEKERIGTELKLASLIQENSIPNIFPPYPERKEFSLYASMTPAKEVGGDFYDFFLIDDDHLALVIADVSGKGIPAALFMMVTKILINENVLSQKSPAKVLTTINNRICKNNKANMFITVWLGIVEISTGKVTAANAGHESPAILKNHTEYKLDENKHGIPIGIIEDYKYQNYHLTLEKGDKIFLYTDGLPEASNANEEMYTIDRMLNFLNTKKNKKVEDMINSIQKEINEFTGETIQFDDLTMLIFEYMGQSPRKDNNNEKKV